MPATNYADPGALILRWADQLAAHSDRPDNLTCAYMTPAHRAVAHHLARWMRDAGFDELKHDAAGNVIGLYRAASSVAAPRLVSTGSHYDTVRDGGRYDGRLGILLPIAVVGALHAEGIRLPYDLEVVGFAEEEGLRFGGTFVGSSAHIGRFDMRALDYTDSENISMRQAIQSAGLDPDAIPAAGIDVSRLLHFFEIHIEQGPVLLDRGLPLGVVSAIAGCVRRMIELRGAAGHAGTTPMDLRQDAACAAAEIVLCVERRCRAEPGLVGTVGQLEVPGGSVNVIPGRCRLSLDVRAGDDARRDAALDDIEREIAALCARRNVAWTCEETMRMPATGCDAAARAEWRRAIAAHGLPVLDLPSGAGHDAMLMASVAPVSMLFVRCGNGGVSHNPLETIVADDICAAAGVVRKFLQSLAAPA